MFKSYTNYLNFEPKDGMSVVILGSVSVFERDGVYQVYAKGMEPEGVGALYKAYEKLKAKLSDAQEKREHAKKKPANLAENGEKPHATRARKTASKSAKTHKTEGKAEEKTEEKLEVKAEDKPSGDTKSDEGKN